MSRDPPDLPELRLAHYRKIPVRERFLRLLFGRKRGVTVIIPGDTVKTVTIEELPEKEDDPP